MKVQILHLNLSSINTVWLSSDGTGEDNSGSVFILISGTGLGSGAGSSGSGINEVIHNIHR